MKRFTLTLATPRGVKLNEEVELVSFYQSDGVRQILAGHTNSHGEFEGGTCYYIIDGVKHSFTTGHGIFTVKEGALTLLSHSIVLESEEATQPHQGIAQAKRTYNDYIKTKLDIVKKSGIK